MKETTAKNEVQKVFGSDSNIYAELLKHRPANDAEWRFISNLKKAVSGSVKPFEVFVNDPSIGRNGLLQFVTGYTPAVGYSYNELEELGKKSGLRLGNINEYVLFLGTLINNLISVEGWNEAYAWNSVCTDSRKLGHYKDSVGVKNYFEPTGSRKIVGKADLANTYKILASGEEKYGGFWLAGGSYRNSGYIDSLASLVFHLNCERSFHHGVGWFVR